MVFIYYTIFNLQRITLTLAGWSISYENSYLIIFYIVSSKSISMGIFEKKITKSVTSSFIFFKSIAYSLALEQNSLIHLSVNFKKNKSSIFINP